MLPQLPLFHLHLFSTPIELLQWTDACTTLIVVIMLVLILEIYIVGIKLCLTFLYRAFCLSLFSEVELACTCRLWLWKEHVTAAEAGMSETMWFVLVHLHRAYYVLHGSKGYLRLIESSSNDCPRVLWSSSTIFDCTAALCVDRMLCDRNSTDRW